MRRVSLFPRKAPLGATPWNQPVTLASIHGEDKSARTGVGTVTAAELRVLEARMETLNAMLQDLVFQARRLQASTSTDQRQQTVIDLFGPPSC